MPQQLNIFISSPGDVSSARRIAADIVDALAQEYSRFLEIGSYLWEHEAMLASKHFQDLIEPPSKFDIVVLIVWSRLGTPLPPKTPLREYKGFDGRVPVTGTEWEFEEALTAAQDRGTPNILVFRNVSRTNIDTVDRAARAKEIAQLDALDDFWKRHFENEGSYIKSFKAYHTQDEFASIVEMALRKIIERRIETLTADLVTQPTKLWTKAPFRGLESYDFEHAPIFFGRSSLISKAIEQLSLRSDAGNAFLLVCGPSGSGKSSLVKAGVIPRLMKPRRISGKAFLRRVLFRPGDSRINGDLIHGFTRAIISHGAKDDIGVRELLGPSQTEADLVEEFRKNPDRLNFLFKGVLGKVTESARASGRPLGYEEAKLILLVDQLEELFTLEAIGRKDRELFIALLMGLAKTGCVWVIATIRADFWHRALEMPELVVLAEGIGRLDVPPPSLAELSDIIRKPAVLAGLSFEEHNETGLSLNDILAEHANAQPGALPLLSFTLDALYLKDVLNNHRQRLTHASYRELGELRGAIASRANEVFLAQSEEARAALPAVLRALVTVKEPGVANATARIAPLSRFPEGKPERKLIDAFLAPDARLLVAEEGSGGGPPQVRVAHEALLTHWDRAREQIGKDRADLRLRVLLEDFAAFWQEHEEDRSLLIPDRLLPEARSLLDRRGNELAIEVCRYIDKSIAEGNKRRQDARDFERLQALWSEKLLVESTQRAQLPTVQVFISGTSDVGPERSVAARVIEQIGREFSYYLRVQPILWEREGMIVAGTFQHAMPRPSDADIAIFVLWGRLGVPLPHDRFVGELSGKVPISAIEWEFENALASARKNERPEILVYHKVTSLFASTTSISEVDISELERKREQHQSVQDFMRRWFQNETSRAPYMAA